MHGQISISRSNLGAKNIFSPKNFYSLPPMVGCAFARLCYRGTWGRNS